MKSLILYIRTLFNKKPYYQHLGRWRIEQCPNKINMKIDLANEDHCGPCGNYKSKQITHLKQITFKK